MWHIPEFGTTSSQKRFRFIGHTSFRRMSPTRPQTVPERAGTPFPLHRPACAGEAPEEAEGREGVGRRRRPWMRHCRRTDTRISTRDAEGQVGDDTPVNRARTSYLQLGRCWIGNITTLILNNYRRLSVFASISLRVELTSDKALFISESL